MNLPCCNRPIAKNESMFLLQQRIHAKVVAHKTSVVMPDDICDETGETGRVRGDH